MVAGHGEVLTWLIGWTVGLGAIGFFMWEVAFYYHLHYGTLARICDGTLHLDDPVQTRRNAAILCAMDLKSGWELYRLAVKTIYIRLIHTHSYLQYSPDDAKVPLRY